MSDGPKPVDNCILYIEQKIRELGYGKYENMESFSAGLVLGMEAGIKQANGDFKINTLESDEQESNEQD